MNPNAEPHELLYLLVGGIGALLTGGVMLMRLGDLALLYYDFERSTPAHRQRLIAWERLLACFGWLFLNLYMILVGANAAMSPPLPFTVGRQINIGIFFFIAIYATALALLQVYLRKRWRKRLQDDKEGGGH